MSSMSKKLFAGSKKKNRNSKADPDLDSSLGHYGLPGELDISGSSHGSDLGSPGSHLGTPTSPSRGLLDSDLTLRSRSMKTKRGGNLGDPPSRPASVAVMSGGGPLSAGHRLSKSNSSTSINSVSDCMETQIVNQEEILQLTRDVRNFSEALNKLKSIFNHDGGERTETIRVAAHERLRDLLNILRGILDKYTALKSTDVHTAAVVLIAQIKGLTSNNEEKDKGHLSEAIDALALAFSNSVTEYLMGDVEQTTIHLGFPASKSCESLVSLSSNPEYIGPSFNKSETASDVREGTGQLNSEEIDAWLMNLEAGVDLALERAKAWSKYAKDVILYVEKRVHLEMEFARSLSKLGATTRPILREETYLPFQSTYLMSLEHDIEYATNCEATYTQIQGHKFVEQLDARRAEHDKKRKSIRLQWNTVKKEMTECRVNLEKSRQLYYSRYHEYERAKEATAKYENEMMNSSGGTHTKLEKRKKAEDEALGKAQEAETTYKACVAETNHKQQDMIRVKQKLLVQLRELIFMCDQTMKAVTHSYFQMQHSLSAPAPIQFQTLCEQIRSYEPGLQFSHYVKHHKRFMSGHALQDTDPLVFEPYNNASSLQRERKTSSQSYDSFEDDKIFLRNRSDSGSRRSDKSQRMQAWQAHPVSDSESISGSSTKSGSPAASPRNGPRIIARDTGGGGLSSGDELGEETPAVTVNSGPNRLIEPIPNAFKNLTLSKAALTHMIRKLRTPSKCRECESYVYFNGAECERCGLACHKKCLESLAINCGGKRLMGKMNVFGVNLSEHLRATGRDVPFIVTKCISEIDKKALQVKGIYRVAGLKVKVEKLCQTFENGADLVDLSESPPHLITSTLKLYLRQLPEPLLTFALYPDFIAAAKEFPQKEGVVYDDAEIIARFKQVISKLPPLHHKTSKALMYHLKRVADEPLNHMSGSNLGIVFGPTLLKLRDANASSLDALIDMNHHTRAIELMALYPEIFGPNETPVEDFTRDEVHSPTDVHRGQALNKSANNSTHLTTTTTTSSHSSSRGGGGDARSPGLGFSLPGSSEEHGDQPERRRRTRHAPQPVKNGHSSDEDGNGSGSDGEAPDHRSNRSPNKPTLLQVAGGSSSQEKTGEPGGYVPSAYTSQSPQRMGVRTATPTSPGGDTASHKQTKTGHNPDSPGQNTQQRRRNREPRFV